MKKIFLQQDAADKIKVEVEENTLLEKAKKYFNWRKNITVVRINKLGTAKRDKFIKSLAAIH